MVFEMIAIGMILGGSAIVTVLMERKYQPQIERDIITSRRESELKH